MTSSFVTKTALALLIGFSIPLSAHAQTSDINAQTDTQTGTETEIGIETEIETGTETEAQTSTGTETGTTVEGSGDVATEASAANTESGASLEADITAEQQTEIRAAITELEVEPAAEVGVDVTVGTTVPATITLTPLPARVIEIVPQYANYQFFVLPDGRIAIVAPSTLEVVYILG